MADSTPPYPEDILPRSEEYKDLICEENLTFHTPELVVQRRASRSYVKGVPSPEEFGENRTEMSVNLLGAYFKPEHVCFVPKGYSFYPSDKPFSGKYDFIPDVKFFGIPIAAVHNKTFPSPRKFPDKDTFEAWKTAIRDNNSEDQDNATYTEEELSLLKSIKMSKQQFSSKTDYTVTYRFQVAHRPTTANYWHCQIEVFPDTDTNRAEGSGPEKELILKKEKSTWQTTTMDKAVKTITNILSGVAACSLSPSIPPEVPPQYYLKTPTPNSSATSPGATS